MQHLADVATAIDQRNAGFITNTKEQLRALDRFSTEMLEWLMIEHYQFSFANTKFLAAAAEATSTFDTDAVRKELLRNCAEENGHAAMYRSALRKIGIAVESRVEFSPTSHFLGTIAKLVEDEPSTVLGAMYATETAAIFEHEVFRDISLAVIARRSLGKQGAALVHFHDMHLSGVEQSHREELGVFMHGVSSEQAVVERQGERPTFHPPQAIAGALRAIGAMESWWDDLLSEAASRSRAALSKQETDPLLAESTDVQDRLRQYVLAEIFGGKQVTGFDDSYDLIESAAMDSLSMMNLVTWLEREYAVQLGLGDILPQNFKSVSAVAKLVARLRADANN